MTHVGVVQSSDEHPFRNADGSYGPEYDSGGESREAINSRIEPYPGDLTKVSYLTLSHYFFLS